MTKLDIHSIQKLLKKRLPESHKGNHGHALIIAGSRSKMGAAIIATKACLRAGAGLVTVNIPRKERLTVFTAIPEAMIEFREEEKNWDTYNSFAIGPGIGIDKSSENLLKLLITNVNSPIIFDADALNILAKNQGHFLLLPQKSIITPHPKEFDRLFGNHDSDSERRKTALSKANELKLIIVLKGHRTFITDGEKSFENTTGNPGLAKGGSGDALTGIITAFLAQDYEPLNAAKLGVFLHGLAADLTLETQSTESMLITDVIENLGKAFKKIQ
ncbi:NAD(P)H-hydrate dehydratase [Flavobacterium wongokense]|uniref:NAD(P)H-hydrate dehydratase n=1 Tax=Flavobacterium wongokense TaxID=2910674 RepID=UPI001F408C78|nr:NAD(P)H-hydrate dehydratase [Flavobacterium sp. WG47]MCF6131447.1 NAD(P)H-hydrate dehydratase [Flavobacterium sp. WG47]